MDFQQLSQEIRDLNDANDRQQVAVEALENKVRFLEERAIPATVAGLAHTVAGVSELLANLAGTLHSVSLQVAALTDRTIVLEGVVDAGAPPLAVDP